MLVNTTGDITLASVPVSRGGKVAEARVASKSKPGTHAGNSGGVVLLVPQQALEKGSTGASLGYYR